MSEVTRRGFAALSLGLSSLAVTSLSRAHADTAYPTRPIRLIVPRSAGGVLDIIGRDWANWVGGSLGAVATENIGGGGGMTGTALVAHATPDGYTLLLGSTSDLVLNPKLTANQLYDPIKDFAPVSGLAISVATIMVNASVPAHSLKELVAYAKANPGKLSYGSAGAGTMSNLCGELFKKLADLPDIVHVPYKGAAGGYSDLLAGNIPIMTSNITGSTLAMHRAGQIRILAVATDHRLAGAEDIPTAAEAGYPDLIAQLFVGLFAPAGTPKDIIDRLAAVSRQAVSDKDFQKKLQDAGFEAVENFGPDRTAQYLNEEMTRWTPILAASGLKPG
ncbi:MAG TPA: tripartite tricarboxylate transporter substrate binding protein [Xanthobacteraceae bacterium]|jgi:tripartite-type tricarboxylate transporter receptor subunit TctC|nr:tripartite tricarboxylate transporter substrate binding protein [Xanthobacteraceae bacterium]